MSIDLLKENDFVLEKTSRRYPAETMIDADNVDDLTLLADKTTEVEFS